MSRVGDSGAYLDTLKRGIREGWADEYAQDGAGRTIRLTTNLRAPWIVAAGLRFQLSQRLGCDVWPDRVVLTARICDGGRSKVRWAIWAANDSVQAKGVGDTEIEGYLVALERNPLSVREWPDADHE